MPFTCLPQELRDAIYSFLATSQQVSLVAWFTSKRIRLYSARERAASSSNDDHLDGASISLKSEPYPLLLVNRLVHQEFRDHLYKSVPIYLHIDLIFNSEIKPTVNFMEDTLLISAHKLCVRLKICLQGDTKQPDLETMVSNAIEAYTTTLQQSKEARALAILPDPFDPYTESLFKAKARGADHEALVRVLESLPKLQRYMIHFGSGSITSFASREGGHNWADPAVLRFSTLGEGHTMSDKDMKKLLDETATEFKGCWKSLA